MARTHCFKGRGRESEWDLFMILIQSLVNGVKPFDYVTELLRQAARSCNRTRSAWMPWNLP